MRDEEILALARAGAQAGCAEALFTLGDKPELRYRAARDELAELGFETTLDYLRHAAELVLEETGLLPHLNPGVMTRDEIEALRPVSASMGIMLESVSERLCERGGAHFGSPDKSPSVRLETIGAAGEANVPFTTGLLIGIGETRAERVETIAAIADLHRRYGHIQEVIVQNFRAKADTLMADHPEPPLEDLLWTIAAARVLLPLDISLQAPPNLSDERFPELLTAGINDWGGVSPVTPDHVNPESPWPDLERLELETEQAGFRLAPRLPIYPEFFQDSSQWLDESVIPATLAQSDASGLARRERWYAGEDTEPPASATKRVQPLASIALILEKVGAGEELDRDEITALFEARGSDVVAVCTAADELRREVSGDEVSFVVNRNINYTNVCYFRCTFCAFSKGQLAGDQRERPYLVPLEEIERRTAEAWDRGATEVCLQGGIHPAFDGEYYLSVVRAAKKAAPKIHIHAFTPLEIWQGATTLGLPLDEYMLELKRTGLGTLPGTSAEILDDEIRQQICPDKNTTAQWLEVMEIAHSIGLRSTATIMFGHVDAPRNWANHIVAVRSLQQRTLGFTEFVPLPFVHMEAPMARRGKSRLGPTFREVLLMHAVARLSLNPWITNVQTSWVKLGPAGAEKVLQSGANDLGGTLMNESISRAAGASFGQEMRAEEMHSLAKHIDRPARQRTTLYDDVDKDRTASENQSPLAVPLNPPARESGMTPRDDLLRPGLLVTGR